MGQALELQTGKRLTVDAKAFLSVAAYCCAALVFSSILGMSWTPSGWRLALVPSFFLAIAGYYARFRPEEVRLLQIALYVGLWSALPLAGTQLTFITNAANFPMQSTFFAQADSAIGFHWDVWAKFMLDRPRCFGSPPRPTRAIPFSRSLL